MDNFEGVIAKRYKEALEETNIMLDSVGICAVIRPTGFGKTILMCEIANQSKYNKVLYVYPTEIIKDSASKNIDINKVDFVSCYYVGKYYDRVDELYAKIYGTYNLVIFDEIHHLGAPNVRKVLKPLVNMLRDSGIHVLGGSATPSRMDGFKVIEEIFDNNTISPYGLNDAIEDGVLPKPYYVYSVDSKYIDSHKISESIDSFSNIKQASRDLQRGVRELRNLVNANVIITEHIHKIYTELPQYMRFMVFFPTKRELYHRSEEVKSWFNSFTKYDVRTTVVHSGLARDEDLNKLNHLGSPKNTIDLIYSINMLNEGYHIDDITGVILLRPTQSPTVYTQQVGRCMSIGMENTPIIFDFVANLCIDSIFKYKYSDRAHNSKSETSQEFFDAISLENIYLVDNVASVKVLLGRLSKELPDNNIIKVYNLRTEKRYPLHKIAKELGLEYSEVYSILLSLQDMLSVTGAELCVHDYYENGNKFNGNRLEVGC